MILCENVNTHHSDLTGNKCADFIGKFENKPCFHNSNREVASTQS
jgi:hypothetical protein